MKKTIGIILSVLLTASFITPSYALILDTAETDEEYAVLSAEQGTVRPLSASGCNGKETDVHPGYPGAYYTFDAPINTDTLTLENIANDEVASFEYDKETNTVILFKSPEKLLCGKTVSFSEWDSLVETVDGERLTFTTLKYKIADYFPNTGSNLIPYGDFEGGFSPVFYAEASETFTAGISEEQDGNKVFLMDASEYSGALYPHAQTGFSFEEGNTYKFVYSIKHAGMSFDANGKTVANKNTNSVGSALFSGSQTGATTNRLVKHQHSFPNVRITYGDDWKKNEYVITVTENDGGYSPEAFSVYTNPQSKSTVCFMLDDIAVYKRCDLLFDAGDDCRLIDEASLPERVPGVFLDGSSEETGVIIPEMEIPFECKAEDWYIDTEKPWKDQFGNTFAPGDTIDLADYNKTVTLVPNIKTDVVYYTVSFDGTGLKNAPSDMTVKEGTVIELTDYYGVSASDTALRFNGWALKESDSLWDACQEITVDGDITLYPIVSYDFNFAIPANRYGWINMNCAVSDYNGKSMLVTQSGANVDVILKRNVSIPTELFSGVTAFFEKDCFNDELLDNVFFNRQGESDNHARSLGPVMGEEINGCYTVNYSAESNSNWSGTITTLRYDPFQANGQTAIRALVFNYYPEITTDIIEVSGITVPITGSFDMTSDTFKENTGVSYFKSVKWSPELKDGKFDEETVYTAEITLSPEKGSIFSGNIPYTISFDGKESAAVFNKEESEISASFIFDKTEPYIEFTAEISGPDKASKKGRSCQFVFVTDTELPDSSASWSVDNTDLATVTQDGRLTPKQNGEVVLRAVSNYDTSVYAEKTVIIENQGDSSKLTYHTGTTDEVTGMPEDLTGKGKVVLSDTAPQREGYVFLGWSESESSDDIVSSVTLAGDDIDVYAVWGKGIVWDFKDNTSYIKGIASGSMTADGENLVCFTSALQTDIRLETVNPELDPSKYHTIVIRMATDVSDKVQIFYKSEYLDGNGETKTVGYNINKDGSFGFGYAAALSVSKAYSGKGDDEYITLVMPMHKTGDVGTWGNESTKKIVGLWIDPFDASGRKCKIDWIAFLEKEEGTEENGTSSGKNGENTPKEYDMTVSTIINTNASYNTGTEEEDEVYEEADTLSYYEASQSNDTVIFNFDDADSTAFFERMHRMSICSAAQSVLSYNSQGYKTKYSFTNPYIETTALAIDASQHPYVIIKAKASGLDNKALTLYFKEKGSVFSEAKSVSADMSVDYTMLVFDMSDEELWNGVIEKLRLSVDGKDTGRLDIDWIMFADSIPESMDKIPGTVERFPSVNKDGFPFEDVKESDWFRIELEQAYRLGFVKGVSESIYLPYGSVTVAEAITLAVRLNAAYNGVASPSEANDGESWYEPYINAALEAGIIKDGQFTDFDAPAKRKEVAAIMAKSVPVSELLQINMFGSIPDISKTDSSYGAVIRLYRAGILTGSDEYYNFRPEDEISRAEIAAIINRIALPSERKRVVTPEEIESLKIKLYSDEITSNAELFGCTMKVFEDISGRAYAVSNTDDPSVILTSLFVTADDMGNPVMMNGEDIAKIRIGMKWDRSAVPNPTEAGCKLYFTTVSGGWSEARSFVPEWDGETDAYSVAELVIDVGENEQFAKQLTAIRFDPFDACASFEIAYITIE